MEKLLPESADLRSLSPATLAFVGDAVFSLLVREHLALCANRPAGALHLMAVGQVNAQAQARALAGLENRLTQREMEIFRRGRNAHTSRSAKNASSAEYHAATGLETLFGYLYLDNQISRLRELFSFITGQQEGHTNTK